jgi:hypothetical protein
MNFKPGDRVEALRSLGAWVPAEYVRRLSDLVGPPDLPTGRRHITEQHVVRYKSDGYEETIEYVRVPEAT